jgi:hypothetical protein
VTRSNWCSTPATNGSASLSPFGRFGRRSPYRAQNYPSGCNIAIVYRAAADTVPTPNREGQLIADVVAIRADARTAHEAAVDVPRSPRPVGFVVESTNKLSQPGIGQRARKTGAHQTFQAQIFDGKAAVSIDQLSRGLVHRVLTTVPQLPLGAADLRHGAAPVDAALATSALLTFQPSQPMSSKPVRRRCSTPTSGVSSWTAFRPIPCATYATAR